MTTKGNLPGAGRRSVPVATPCGTRFLIIVDRRYIPSPIGLQSDAELYISILDAEHDIKSSGQFHIRHTDLLDFHRVRLSALRDANIVIGLENKRNWDTIAQQLLNDWAKEGGDVR